MAPRILIVDDEHNHRRALSISLRMEGYEVLEAADGQSALDVLATEHADVVVADLMMPRIDGLELARRLRFSRPHVKLILMSAYHLTRAQIERAQVGEIRFLPKPYPFDMLAGEAVPRLDGIGIERHGGAQRRLGVGGAAGGDEREPEAQRARGVLWSEPVRAGEQVHGLGGAALLEGNDAGKMDGVKMVGQRGPHPSVKRLGLVEPAGTVMHHGILQQALVLGV